MNRAERRKQGKKISSEPVINIKASDIKNIKNQASKDAVDIAFILMLAIPAMVLRDKYGELMRKVVNGKSRCERFTDLCLDLYKSYEKGEITLDDLHQFLWEEAGIKVEKR